MTEGFLNLVRTVPAPEQEDGEGVRLLSLEVYDDGFIIRWELPSGVQSAEEAGVLPDGGLMTLTLADDLHTRYEFVGPSGDGTMFRPAIPPEAMWLDVFTKGGTVRFELQPSE